MAADKRIPVTEKRWKQLNNLKDAGQTYDELLKELIQSYNRSELAEQARETRDADTDELTELNGGDME